MNAAIADAGADTVDSAPACAREWAQPQSGDVIAGKYEVERILGTGGMGIVVEARHRTLSQKVAVKFLLPGVAGHPDIVRRFLREARAAAGIRSEHVVRVFDVGEHDGAPYIVMEHLTGRDLEQVLEEQGPLSIDDAIGYVLQACEALAEAHAMGVVHRDLKPANLFLSRRADGAPLIKVLDFGIAKVAAEAAGADPGLTATGSTMGSPRYMSPEQIRNAKGVDGRADVWALGVVLQELISGHAPFNGDSGPALCAMIVADEPVPLRSVAPDAPEALELVLLRCLEKDPARRWPDVAAFATALEGVPRAPSTRKPMRVVEPTHTSALAATLPEGSGPISGTRALSGPSRTEPSWRVDPSPPAPRTASRRSVVACAVVLCGIASTVALMWAGHASTAPRLGKSIGTAWIRRWPSDLASPVPAPTAAPLVTLVATAPADPVSSPKLTERPVRRSPAPVPAVPIVEKPSREAKRDPLGDRK